MRVTVCPLSQQVRRCRSLRPIGRDSIASIPTSIFLKVSWKLRKRVDESKEVLSLQGNHTDPRQKS